MMIVDDIIQEVRTHREQIAQECDYDLHKIFVRMRSMKAPIKPTSRPLVQLSDLGVVITSRE
jgi:hypothetical protein